jgi:hypothetical protein
MGNWGKEQIKIPKELGIEDVKDFTPRAQVLIAKQSYLGGSPCFSFLAKLAGYGIAKC